MRQDKGLTVGRQFRKLEDLDLLDNFLFQEMLSWEEGEEFARILLSTILDKEIHKVRIISQKSILGADTDRHGIRLDAYIEDFSGEAEEGAADAEIIPDIYDVEPNKTYEKDTLPRRMRYYHGLIDSQFLASGADYGKLPRVVIILILPYDPFGKDRMIYTIQNCCKEDLSVGYDDGAQKIFLYTKGKVGIPSQRLADMLRYIERSTDKNVVNKDIETIQKLVKQVKGRKEVSISYMKSWEIEEMIRKESYSEGHGDGYDEGRNEGQDRVNLLNVKLGEAGRLDDIMKAAKDKAYQETLFGEFGL